MAEINLSESTQVFQGHAVEIISVARALAMKRLSTADINAIHIARTPASPDEAGGGGVFKVPVDPELLFVLTGSGYPCFGDVVGLAQLDGELTPVERETIDRLCQTCEPPLVRDPGGQANWQRLVWNPGCIPRPLPGRRGRSMDVSGESALVVVVMPFRVATAAGSIRNTMASMKRKTQTVHPTRKRLMGPFLPNVRVFEFRSADARACAGR